VSENRVLRRIIGTKRDEMMGGCIKLPNEELQDLHSSPNIIRIIKSGGGMRWAWLMVQMGEKRKAYRLLIGKPKGKSPPGRPRLRWV
jgi:hypothetical protein